MRCESVERRGLEKPGGVGHQLGAEDEARGPAPQRVPFAGYVGWSYHHCHFRLVEQKLDFVPCLVKTDFRGVLGNVVAAVLIPSKLKAARRTGNTGPATCYVRVAAT